MRLARIWFLRWGVEGRAILHSLWICGEWVLCLYCFFTCYCDVLPAADWDFMLVFWPTAMRYWTVLQYQFIWDPPMEWSLSQKVGPMHTYLSQKCPFYWFFRVLRWAFDVCNGIFLLVVVNLLCLVVVGITTIIFFCLWLLVNLWAVNVK